jgi:hypothetical protein
MARSHGHRSASVSGCPSRIFSMFASGWNVSASANVQCSRPASKAPTVLLPLPDGPAMIKITLTESSRGGSVPRRARLSGPAEAAAAPGRAMLAVAAELTPVLAPPGPPGGDLAP